MNKIDEILLELAIFNCLKKNSRPLNSIEIQRRGSRPFYIQRKHKVQISQPEPRQTSTLLQGTTTRESFDIIVSDQGRSNLVLRQPYFSLLQKIFQVVVPFFASYPCTLNWFSYCTRFCRPILHRPFRWAGTASWSRSPTFDTSLITLATLNGLHHDSQLNMSPQSRDTAIAGFKQKQPILCHEAVHFLKISPLMAKTWS